jgi:hypothetical protein
VTNVITQILLDHLPSSRKAPNGWMSFNAVCCDHRGHSTDRRRRGGVMLTADGVVYSCFNCQFSTGYKKGGYLGIKFRKLLNWAGVDESTIDALRIQALRDRDNLSEEDELRPEIHAVPRDLPPHSVLLNAKQHPVHWEYLVERGIDPDCYPFYVSSDNAYNMSRRVIVPFTYQNHLVGYTARSIYTHKPKYIQCLGMPYVFGTELQQRNWTWTPVVEGVLDAISINGMSVLGNEVNEQQAEQLEALNKTLIVVPDQDRSGDLLVQAAIDFGWSVCWPEWPSGVKDVNDAVKRFGALFVTRHIWTNRITGPTQIKLHRKLKAHSTK